MRPIRALITTAVLLVPLTAATGAQGAPRASAPRSAAPAPGADTALVAVREGEKPVTAFVAWPAGRRPAPVVLVGHEWWGLNIQIRDIAMRLSKQGYIAVVPDLYHGKVAADPMQAHELSRGLENEAALSDLDAAAAWVLAQPRARGAKLGVLGFCMGGGVALQYALHRPDLGAAVMFYGSPESDPARIAGLAVPLEGHFGAEDQGITPARVEEFRGALEKAGRQAEIFVYPGAGHAFMNDTQPSFRADAARLAWSRTLAFLQKHLKTE